MSKLTTLIPFLMLVACGGSELAPERSAEPSPAAAPVATEDADDAEPKEPVGFHAADMTYRPCAPGMPEGCELTVLEGDPSRPGMFTLRVRAPGAFTVEPHSHPGFERITVLAGTVHVGFGDTLDKSRGRAYSAGDFYMNPAGANHYVWADGPVTLQITGRGPRRLVKAGDHAH